MAQVLRTLAVQISMNSAQFRKDVDNVDRRFRKMSRNIRSRSRLMGGAISKAGLIFGAVFGGRIMVNAADIMIDLRNKMQSVTTTTGEMAFAMSEVKRIAEESRADIGAMGTLYQRLIVSTKSLGFSLRDVSDATQVVADTFILSGTTSQEAANSARQFAQGMASGAIKGDEFRSISENNVVLMNLLAEGLNMSVGQLKLFAAEGGLTAEVVLPILQEALIETRGQIDNMQMSLSQGWTQISNSWTELMDRLNQKYGIFNKVANVLKKVADNLGYIAAAAVAAAAIITPIFVFGALRFMGIWLWINTKRMYELAKSFTIFMWNTFVAGATAAGNALMWMGTKAIGLLVNMSKLVAYLSIFVAIAGVIGVALASVLAKMNVWSGESSTVFKGLFDSLGEYLGIKMFQWVQELQLFYLETKLFVAKVLKVFGKGGSEKVRAQLTAEIRQLEGEITGLSLRAGTALENLPQGMMDELEKVVDFLGEGLVTATDKVAAAFGKLGPALSQAFEDLGGPGAAEAVGGMLGDAWEALKGMPQAIMDVMPGLQEFMDVLSGAYNPDENNEDPKRFDPDTWAGRWKIAIAKVQTGLQAFKDGFTDVFVDAIMGVKSLKEGFLELANVLTTTIVKAFVEMFAQWIVSKITAMVAQKAIEKGAAAATVATAVATAVPVAAAWAPAAALVSLATFGTNSAAAMTGMAAAGAFAEGMALLGVAHDGMDAVPTTGTYLLEKGERVVDGRLNGDLKTFLANDSGGGRGDTPAVTFNVNGVSDADVVMEALYSRRGEVESLLQRLTLDRAGAAL